MALSGKLETDFELKSSADDFYHVFKRKAFDIPNHTPTNIQAVAVHEGDWDTHGHGSIKIWNYSIEGRKEVFKERVEFDDHNRKVTLVGLEGDVMKTCKVYNPIFHLIPKPSGSLAKLIIEYEMRKEGLSPPYIYMDFIIRLTKDIDESISKA